MITIVRYILIFVLALVLQLFVLDQVPQLIPFSRPVLFFVFIVALPDLEAVWLMAIGFVGGLVLDMFYGTPGINAAACVLLAYFRDRLVRWFKDDEDENVKASAHIGYLGFARYFFFILLVSFVFHLVTEFLSVFTMSQFGQTLLRVVVNTILSAILIYIFEIIVFYRRSARA